MKEDEENRQDWPERNRERFARIAAMPPKLGQEEIRAKLASWKAKIVIDRNIEGQAKCLWETIIAEGWLDLVAISN